MTDPPSRLRRILPLLLGAIALGILTVFLVRNWRHIAENYAPRPGAFALMALLVLAALTMRGIAHKRFFGGLGVEAPWGDWFRLVAISSFTNYLPFSAGLAVRAVFMKRVFGASFPLIALGHGVLLIVIMSTNGLAGLLALGLSSPDSVTSIIGAVFLLMASSALLLFLPVSLTVPLMTRIFGRSEKPPPIRRDLFPLALLQAGTLLAAAAMLKISFGLGPETVGFSSCVVFTAAGMLTRFVTITPGGIGAREFLIGALAHLVGFELRDAVIAAALTRLAEIPVVFTLGSIYTFSFSRRFLSTYDD